MDPDNPPAPIAEQLEQFIANDSVCISVKYNLNDEEIAMLEANPDSGYGFDSINNIRQFLEDHGVIITHSTVGLHLNGKAQKPHIHYHVIALSNATKPTNPSDKRTRWLNKKANKGKTFGDLQIKYQSLDTKAPKYGFLSYPLKEGLCPKWALKSDIFMIINERKMTNLEYIFLKEVGSSIYDTQLGLRLRQDRCEERKQNNLMAMFVLCEASKSEFSSYTSMVVWLDTNYIAKLEINEYPDPKNYKTICQKVAVKLGYLKYSAMCV